MNSEEIKKKFSFIDGQIMLVQHELSVKQSEERLDISRFLFLVTVLYSLSPLLVKHGLGVSHYTWMDPHEVEWLITEVFNEYGDRKTYRLRIVLTKHDLQEYISVTSELRRLQLCMIFKIA